MKFHADIRSHFSLGESILTIDEIAAGLAGHGWEAAALCDTMSISAMPDFTKRLDKAGLKPIIGCRLRLVETLDRNRKQKAVFPKLFVHNQDGLERLQHLLSVANDDDHFYYVPRLCWQDVLDVLDADAFSLATGSLYSAIRDSQSIATLRQIKAILGASNTLIELCPIDSPLWDRQSYEGAKVAEELGLATILTRPALYAAGDHEALQVMNAIISNRKMISEEFRSHVQDYDWKTPPEVVAACRAQVGRIRRNIDPSFGSAAHQGSIGSWKGLCDRVSFKWAKRDITLPTMAPDEDAALKEAAKKGFSERVKRPTFGVGFAQVAPMSDYVERLKKELDVITGMGFAGYFLLVADIVQWSKDQGILVGPGRGSVGGSLVAYCLGITDVDPLRFGLLFERFINPERIDLPDADLDFMSTRRHDVIDYIERTWGKDQVAGISNYTTLGSASAIRDVARIMGLGAEQQNISKHVPKEHGNPVSLKDALEQSQAIATFAARHPGVWQRASALEEKNRSLSRHAAGIVVAGEPVVKRAVIEKRSGDRTVNWDKRVVEDMGLVKIDILGLATLDLMRLALDYIWERHGERIDLNALPLDDENVMKAFGAGLTIGVFQFESPGMRRLLRDLRRGGDLTFEDVAAATALYRPGPMDSGLLDDFVQIRQGYIEPYYEHEAMRPALEETYSVIVYQEQVMRIARDLCGFTLAESDHLRKAIGKKDMDKMKTLGGQFIDGAVDAGMNKTKAEDLWEKIVKFAGYAFNKSHAVEYSLISYQSMWLKANYPIEFFAAALTILNDDKRQTLLADAKQWDIEVGPPDVNISTSRFEILTDTRLAAPFPVVKGLSEKGTNVIVKEREQRGPFKDVPDFEGRVPARSCNAGVRKKLDEIGAYARLQPGALPATAPERRKAQLEFCPAIVSGGVLVDRDIPRDRDTFEALVDLIKEFKADGAESLTSSVRCKPRFGRRARFLVVTDGPTWSEDQAGEFAAGKSFAYIKAALEEAELDVEDGYWTGHSKVAKRKGEKFYDRGQMTACTPYLDKELKILKPQVIVVLGSNAMRHLAPGLKGGNLDHAGKVIYDPKRDANIVIGINPAMITFDEEKQHVLNEVFAKVKEMVG